MSGQHSLQGSLVAGPPAVTGSPFPGSSSTAALGLLTEPKSHEAAVPVLTFTIDSPSAFATLGGLGAGGPVVRANTIYFRCDGKLRVRLTIDDGAGGQYTSVLPLQGTMLLELPDDEACLLVEAKGQSALEYFFAGPA